MTRTLPWGSKEDPEAEPARSPNPSTEKRTLPWDKQSSASASRKRSAPNDPKEGSSKRQAVEIDLTQDSPINQRHIDLIDLTRSDEYYDSLEVSYGCINTKIVGVQYYAGIASPGETVTIAREPDNPYDSNAIKVSNVRGVQVGHIPRTMAAKLAPLMDEGILSLDATLEDPVTNFNSGLSITIFGPPDQERKSALMDQIKNSGIKLAKDPATIARERAEKEAQKAKAKAEKERIKAEKERKKAQKRKNIGGGGGGGAAWEEGDPHASETTFDGMAVAGSGGLPSDEAWQDLVAASTEFNPRDVQSVVDKMGKGEDELKNLPFASQPDAIKTKLLPYQLQGLAWLLQMENPQPPREKEDLVQLWRQHPAREDCYENVATKFSCRKADLENLLCSGGILSDDMGLGKTLQMIALICADVTKEKNLIPNPKNFDKDCAGTLIVAPVSVMSNWSGQIATHVAEEYKLSVHLHHSSKRGQNEDLSKYDVVITSYGCLNSDLNVANDKRTKKSNTTIYSYKWRRIILDEAHNIRNPKTHGSINAAQLKGQSKWCLTGTPIVNHLKDLYSLIRFIGLGGGLSDFQVFNAVVIRRVFNGEGSALLQAIMAQLCLRRMKDHAFVNLDIPPLTEYVNRIRWTEEERYKYDLFNKEAQGIFEDYIAAKGKKDGGALVQYRFLLEILLRMRQLCNHPSLCHDRMAQLLEFAKDMEGKPVDLTDENTKLLQELLQLSIDSREECAICLEELHNPVITTCKHHFGRECIERVINTQNKCPMCRAELPDAETTLVEPAPIKQEPEETDEVKIEHNYTTLNASGSSSKLDALMNILKANRNKKDGAKVVIFSQWTSFLDIIQARIVSEGYKFTRIDGTMPVRKRDAALEKLDNDPECTIMLASLAVCSVGLNLTSASIAVLMDPWWAPAIEDQAVDRIHRLGQRQPTQVFRLVMEDSIEDRVIAIQKRKRDLISDAFMDGGKKKRGQAKEARLEDLHSLLGGDNA